MARPSKCVWVIGGMKDVCQLNGFLMSGEEGEEEKKTTWYVTYFRHERYGMWACCEKKRKEKQNVGTLDMPGTNNWPWCGAWYYN